LRFVQLFLFLKVGLTGLLWDFSHPIFLIGVSLMASGYSLMVKQVCSSLSLSSPPSLHFLWVWFAHFLSPWVVFALSAWHCHERYRFKRKLHSLSRERWLLCRHRFTDSDEDAAHSALLKTDPTRLSSHYGAQNKSSFSGLCCEPLYSTLFFLVGRFSQSTVAYNDPPATPTWAREEEEARRALVSFLISPTIITAREDNDCSSTGLK
jgi:hypothetical protein